VQNFAESTFVQKNVGRNEKIDRVLRRKKKIKYRMGIADNPVTAPTSCEKIYTRTSAVTNGNTESSVIDNGES
jgi:hypothetical protein